MWMTEYIRQIKVQFRDKYNFKPNGGTEREPLFNNIPNGTYPMDIDGKIDYVVINNDGISCCNFKEDNAGPVTV